MNVRGFGITYFQDTVKDMQIEKKKKMLLQIH